MRINLVVGEAITGLRRNLTMTVAAVLVISIALGLLGTANLIRQQINEMQKFWFGRVEVSLFLCSDIDTDLESCPDGAVTDAQRQQIQSDLQELPQVKEIFYESKQDAFERFQEEYAGTEIANNITADDLPESFRVKLVDPENDYTEVASAFEGRAGIANVVDSRSIFEALFSVLNGFRLGSLVVAAVAMLATVLLIVVVIRVAAFSRRRETSIMRLVGASNLSIQLPFLLEGAFAGVVGGLIACFYVAIGKYFFVDQLFRERFAFNQAAYIGWSHVFTTCALVMIVGLVVSIVVSYLTLLKYLRV
ncbi:MAG: permease-like cell division protein FtsX [Candidatus Nanopelagicales bacterium]